ncbi:hypothetical protein ACFO4O_13385 [Glaciecola siphonariae]|uniref:Uncharacterized protein n=1 Tax=Glaciecola siphonariae TaxID=521012 RepID=A0ABV9LZ40_9ALTE
MSKKISQNKGLAQNEADLNAADKHDFPQQNSINLTKSTDLQAIELSEIDLNESDQINSESSDAYTEIKEPSTIFENDIVFSSIEEAHDYFVLANGAIMKNSLQVVFADTDFTNVLNGFDQLASDEKSSKRVANLKHYFYDKFSDNTHSERFSCAGSICAATFVSSDGNLEHYQTLSEFDKNYIFTNVTKNEYDESVYKMIIVETDDPSTLSISSN